MRNVLAVLLGAMVAIGFVTIGDAMAARLFELPTVAAGTDPAVAKTMMEAAIAKAPLSAMLAMVAGYFVAAFGGAFVARKIAAGPGLRPSLTVGAIVLLATIANFAALQHPTLLVVLGVLVPMPGAYVGAKVADGRRETGDGRRKTEDVKT
jgi:hypothetical protein